MKIGVGHQNVKKNIKIMLFNINSFMFFFDFALSNQQSLISTFNKYFIFKVQYKILNIFD